MVIVTIIYMSTVLIVEGRLLKRKKISESYTTQRFKIIYMKNGSTVLIVEGRLLKRKKISESYTTQRFKIIILILNILFLVVFFF